VPLKYVTGHDKLVADFVTSIKRALGDPDYAFNVDRIRTIGVLDSNNELIAGLIYHGYAPAQGVIELTVEALPKKQWLTRSTLAVMFQYPFIECGCQMLMTKTSLRHEHVLRMLAALNFQFINIPRIYGRDRDGVLCLLTDDDWKANKICRRFRHDLVPGTMENKTAA